MAGQQGYVHQNIYIILNKGNNDDTNDGNTIITQTTAATTMGSMMGTTYANTTTLTNPAEVTPAIYRLLANQTAIMQQMVAMPFSPPPPFHCSSGIQSSTHSKCGHPQPGFFSTWGDSTNKT
jgi:hypothetical protein